MLRGSRKRRPNTMRVLRDGFIVLCNIVKPVTQVNAPYLAKRWASLQAACGGEGVIVPNWMDIGGLPEGSGATRIA